MTDQLSREKLESLVEAHPASKLALACLEKLKLPRHPRATPLLDLLVSWLDSLPPSAADGRNNYLEDLQTEARLLMDQPQAAAVALLVNDYETLREQLTPGREWEILDDHLSQLLRSMQESQKVEAAARVLADNLETSLRLQSLASDPQSP